MKMLQPSGPEQRGGTAVQAWEEKKQVRTFVSGEKDQICSYCPVYRMEMNHEAKNINKINIKKMQKKPQKLFYKG